MKTLQFLPNNGKPKGFALIMVLTISALVTLTVLALVALSVNQTRIGRSDRERARAQANAVLSMKIALGELQRQAGPDQRITANGSIFSANQPYLAGIWESWNYNPLTTSSAPDYAAEKTNRFRKWLMSGLTDVQARNKDFATQANPFRNNTTTGVQLVGPGSVGSSTDVSQHVWAGRVSMKQGDGRDVGTQAYAILDEGQKARVNAAPVPKSQIKSNADAMARVGAPARAAIEKADTSLAIFKDKTADLAKVPTFENIALFDNSNTTQKFSHDLSISSAGVLADVANGGLRRDLSVLFQQGLPADMKGKRMYSGTPSGVGLQDPLWDMFFNYARPGLAPSGRGSAITTVLGQTGFAVNSGANIDSFNIGTTQFDGSTTVNDYKDTTQAHTPIAPVIARCEVFYSAFVKRTHGNWASSIPVSFGSTQGNGWDYMLHLVYQPVITLWNPYNVPVQMDFARIEIETPPMAFKFRRIPAAGTERANGVDISGDINTNHVPLNQFYVYGGDRNKIKRFILNLYHDKPTGGGYPTDRTIKFLPGEVRVFSPYVPANTVWDSPIPADNDSGSGSSTVSLFDYLNQNIPQLPTAPGWNGFQYGFNIDWCAPNHNNYYNAPKNGPVQHQGVIGSRLTDSWEIEVMPQAQIDPGGQPFRTYAISLADKNTSRIYSRLEFFHDGNNSALAKALGARNSSGSSTAFPLVCGPFLAQNHTLGLAQPLSTASFYPLFSLSAQAKTSLDAPFPSRPWIQNNATRPLVQVDLTKQNQAWSSHELAIVPFSSGGFQYDTTNNRGYFLSGRYPDTGSTIGVIRDTPLQPIQGVAQLAHTNLSSASRLLPNVDLAVGQSFAHPLIPSAGVRYTPSALGYEVYDHSYLANYRLWDSWYASTLSAYQSAVFTGNTRRYDKVVSDFFTPTATSGPLMNPQLTRWFGASGGGERAVAEFKTSDNTNYMKPAAYQMLSGAFNVNSTSVAAWKAVLASLNSVNVPLMSADDATGKTFSFKRDGFARETLADAGTYFAKSRLANSVPPGRTATGDARWQLWLAGRELTDAELEALANAIVTEVKLRGPFLSLAEFVNRRLTDDEELSLAGTLQAAINKAGLGANNLQGYADILDTDDVKDYEYAFTKAAEGSTGTGASSTLDQLAVLTGIGSSLSARSDTFKIRFYGDAKDAAGKPTSRAYGEAVVQRTPDYIQADPDTTAAEYADGSGTDGNASYEPADPAAAGAVLSTLNQFFGRRFTVVSFRWLAPDEI